jgi:hypothetical protein
MNAFIASEQEQIKAPPAPSCGAVGLSMRTGKKDIFEEAGF